MKLSTQSYASYLGFLQHSTLAGVAAAHIDCALPYEFGHHHEVSAILRSARRFRASHAFIAGNGDPLFQPDEVADLVVGLKEEWRAEGEDDWRPGMRVALATPGLVFDETVTRHVDHLVLRPSLVGWNNSTITDLIYASLSRFNQVTVAMHSSGEGDIDATLLRMCMLYEWAHKRCDFLVGDDGLPSSKRLDDLLHFSIATESYLGRVGIEMLRLSVERWMSQAPPGCRYPTVRVITV